MNKGTERWIYSVGGVIAVFVALLAANFILGLAPVRLDLTAGRLYTLSEGTRKVLGKLEAPVKIRYYFNQGDANVPVGLRVFAGRVDDLLNEMRAASNGKLVIEKLNPQPDSDAEDSAGLDGVEAQELPSGDKFYHGLTVSFADQKLALPVLAPDRERLLEYDLARAIARVTTTTKPVVGVMSPLPLFGMPTNPMMGMGAPGSEPQIFIAELRRDFELKRVSMDVDRIENGIKTLVVVHPRGISEQAQFALDQFVLRGGKLIVFLDPYAYFDQMPGMPGMPGGQGGTSSNLDKLVKAWGYEFDPKKIVLDMQYMAGSGPRAVPTVIQLDANAMSKDDVATSNLGTTLLAFSGAFSGKPAEGLKETVLMHTSPIVKMIDSANAMARGEEAVRGFQPDGKEHPIALRLAGKFRTAFPDGRPQPKEAADRDGKAKPAPIADLGPVLKEGEGTVVLVADSDMLNDGATVQIRDIFGQKVAIPINGNLAFIQGLVEQMAGDSDLVNVRSRATASRPFTVVKQMEAEASQAYLGKIKSLEDNLQETRKKLESLQKTKAPAGGGAILSPEQQAEVENFRKRAADTRRELKDVRRELRAETEGLEFWTKVVNIALMPLLVALAGIAIAVVRRRRRAAT